MNKKIIKNIIFIFLIFGIIFFDAYFLSHRSLIFSKLSLPKPAKKIGKINSDDKVLRPKKVNSGVAKKLGSSGGKKTEKTASSTIKVLGMSQEFLGKTQSVAGNFEANLPNQSLGYEIVKIDRVIDGDTIVLTTGEHIRYIGVNAPELNDVGAGDDECLAWAAKLRNEELLKNKELEIIKDKNADKDKYGRLLRYVYVGDVFVNEVLAREGLAVDYFCLPGWKNCPVTTDKVRHDEIILANKEAREKKRGVYSGVCGKKNLVMNYNSAYALPGRASVDRPPLPLPKVETSKMIFYSSGAGGGDIKKVEVVVASTTGEVVPVLEVVAPIISEVKIISFDIFDLETLNNNYTASTSVGVKLEMENKDLAEKFCLSKNENMPDFTDFCWGLSVPEKFKLSEGDGLKNVFIYIKQGDKIIKSQALITLDTVDLLLNFVKFPETNSSSTEAIFKINTNKNLASGKFIINNSAWQNILPAEEIKITSLTDGEQNFIFQGTDLTGKVKEINYHWTIDASAPTGEITLMQNQNNTNVFALNWTGFDSGSGVDSYSLKYQIGVNNPWQDWLINSTDNSGIFDLVSTTSGELSFKIQTRDALGNLSDWSEATSTILFTEEKLFTKHIVISRVQFSSSASAYDEFIEIYNPTDQTINLNNYRLSRKTKTGTELNLLTKFSDFNLVSHGYYFVAHTKYDGVKPADSLYSTTASIAADNTIILYSDAGKTVVDKVGVGEAIDFEGSVFPTNPLDGYSIIRKANVLSTAESMSVGGADEFLGNGFDSDDNGGDFVLGAGW